MIKGITTTCFYLEKESHSRTNESMYVKHLAHSKHFLKTNTIKQHGSVSANRFSTEQKSRIWKPSRSRTVKWKPSRSRTVIKLKRDPNCKDRMLERNERCFRKQESKVKGRSWHILEKKRDESLPRGMFWKSGKPGYALGWTWPVYSKGLTNKYRSRNW